MNRRAPRVLLVVENVPFSRDHRLRKQVQALAEAGYRVSVVCRRDPDNVAPPGVRLREYRAPADARNSLGFLREYGQSILLAGWQVLRAFFAEGFDAIQISGTPDIYFVIATPFRLLGRAVVLDLRDLSPELFEIRFGRRGPVHRVLTVLERLSMRLADRTLVVNRSLAAVATGRGRLPAEHVTIVGNGPTMAATEGHRERPELRRGHRHLAVWIGLMGPQDQVELAVRAVAHLVHALGRTDCLFAFVGDGECREDAERLARDLDVAEHVCFPGWLHQDEAFDYLATASIGIEPNLEDVVSPVKAMEYLAFGVPMVAFDLDETRVLAGTAARYVPRGDVAGFAAAVDALLDDRAARERMSRDGRRTVRDTLAWEHQASAYLDVYRDLVGPGRALRSASSVRHRAVA